MYYFNMTRSEIKKILENDYQSIHTIAAIMCGRRQPNAHNRYRYEKEYGIPFDAWRDIRQWLEKQSEEGENIARAGTEKEDG